MRRLLWSATASYSEVRAMTLPLVAVLGLNSEVYAIDSVSNALSMFSTPEFFVKRPTASSAGR